MGHNSTREFKLLRLVRFAAGWIIISPFLLRSTPFEWINTEFVLAPLSRYSLAGIFGLLVVSIVAIVVQVENARTLGSTRNGLVLWCGVSLYLVAVLLSCFTVVNEGLLTQDSFRVAVAILVGLACSIVLRDTEDSLLILLQVATVASLYAIADYFHSENVTSSGSVLRAGGLFDEPNVLGFLMAVSLPLACLYIHRSTTPWRMALGLISGSLIFAALVLTFSRSAILALFAGVFVALTNTCYRSVRSVAAIIAVALIACVAINGLRVHDLRSQLSTASSDGGHMQLVHDGLRAFEQRWRSGWGMGALNLPVVQTETGSDVVVTYSHPSNIPLLWLDEWGLSGGIIYAVWVAGVYRVLRRSRGAFDSRATLIAIWICIAVMSMFDTVFGFAPRAASTVIVGVLLGTTMRHDSMRET